jgi:hypothetical protein
MGVAAGGREGPGALEAGGPLVRPAAGAGVPVVTASGAARASNAASSTASGAASAKPTPASTSQGSASGSNRRNRGMICERSSGSQRTQGATVSGTGAHCASAAKAIRKTSVRPVLPTRAPKVAPGSGGPAPWTETGTGTGTEESTGAVTRVLESGEADVRTGNR